jgi:hypothetical protein
MLTIGEATAWDSSTVADSAVAANIRSVRLMVFI